MQYLSLKLALSWRIAVACHFMLIVSWHSVGRAADNCLTSVESATGWKLLFNGKDLTYWKANNGVAITNKLIESDAINPLGSGGEILVYDHHFGDFVLVFDVKMSAPACYSGVFFRVSDLAHPVLSGLEVQILSERGVTMHDFGAIYDLVAPNKNAIKGASAWDHIAIRCQGPIVSVVVNGEHVTNMNCDDFADPGFRPDGTRHKFGRAIKDFARRGYIGFQDHGHDVWYKNIKILQL